MVLVDGPVQATEVDGVGAVVRVAVAPLLGQSVPVVAHHQAAEGADEGVERREIRGAGGADGEVRRHVLFVLVGLDAHEEVQPVLDDGSAHVHVELSLGEVLREGLVRVGGPARVVGHGPDPGHQGLGTDLVEGGSAELVGARLGNGVDHRARRVAVLGIEGVGDDLEFLDGVGTEGEGDAGGAALLAEEIRLVGGTVNGQVVLDAAGALHGHAVVV